MWVEDGHIQLPETCMRFNSETHQIFSTRHIEISRGPQTSSESPIWRGCNLHLCSLNFVFEETPRPLEDLRTALKARWRNPHIYTGRPRSIVTKIGIISISMFYTCSQSLRTLSCTLELSIFGNLLHKRTRNISLWGRRNQHSLRLNSPAKPQYKLDLPPPERIYCSYTNTRNKSPVTEFQTLFV